MATKTTKTTKATKATKATTKATKATTKKPINFEATLSDLSVKHITAIDNLNKALKNNKDTSIAKNLAEAEKLEEKYTSTKRDMIYSAARLSDDPLAFIIKTREFTTIAHKAVIDKKTKKITEYKAISPLNEEIKASQYKTVRLRMVDFCEASKLDTAFAVEIKHLNKLMYLASMFDLKMTPQEILDKNDSKFMSDRILDLKKFLKEATTADGTIDVTKAKSKNPVSRKNLVAQIDVIFKALPINCEITATKRTHLEYLEKVCMREGRKAWEVEMFTDGKFEDLVQNMVCTELCDRSYAVIGLTEAESKAKRATKKSSK